MNEFKTNENLIYSNLKEWNKYNYNKLQLSSYLGFTLYYYQLSMSASKRWVINS